MFWIKRNTLERKLADAMGYEYCTLFDTARSALLAWARREGYSPSIYLPTNICSLVWKLLPEAKLAEVNPETGLSSAPVQLYGYRQEFKYSPFELDPLMTGFLRQPNALRCIISFGPKKMLDAGGGGALLSNDPFKGKAYFPEGLRDPVEKGLGELLYHVERQRIRIDAWDRCLGDSCARIPQEQIMPWRVMRRIPSAIDCRVMDSPNKRDAVVKALRDAAIPVGTNYPPLPGVTDAGALEWGKTVINFFPDWGDKSAACEIIKRTIAA